MNMSSTLGYNFNSVQLAEHLQLFGVVTIAKDLVATVDEILNIVQLVYSYLYICTASTR